MMIFLKHQIENSVSILNFESNWRRENYDQLLAAFNQFQKGEIKQEVVLNFKALENLDTYGALLIHKFVEKLKQMNHQITFHELDEHYEKLLHSVSGEIYPYQVSDTRIGFVEELGKQAIDFLNELNKVTVFFGHFIISMLQSFISIKYFYFKAFSAQCYRVGLSSLPIVGLLSFLIGVVMAYQGAIQLEKFGAQIFVVDLLGISIMREIGVLFSGIIVAGRVGSAFTAQIGMMQVNEEIDAIKLIGLNEFHCLINPRILALIFTMPFVAFYADCLALLGGAVICDLFLNINYLEFYSELKFVMSLSNFGFGLAKAPLFGVLIGVIGCYHGITVERKADSVGLKTTKSVVHSIFMIIVLDAFFSVLGTK